MGPKFALGAAALSAGPLAARADSIEEIAARANAKAKADREAAYTPEPEVSSEEKLKPIITALGASVVLSVPFYYKNLQRLFTKVSSGGEDDGYSKKGKKMPKVVEQKGSGFDRFKKAASQ